MKERFLKEAQELLLRFDDFMSRSFDIEKYSQLVTEAETLIDDLNILLYSFDIDDNPFYLASKRVRPDVTNVYDCSKWMARHREILVKFLATLDSLPS